MNNLEWLRQQLARYTYRPGWTWEVEVGGGVFMIPYYIITRFTATNAYPPHDEVEIKSQYSVPHFVVEGHDPELFKHWFPNMIMNVEQHESREWLRCDGELVNDPHKSAKILPLTPGRHP